jgi:hypothetical protein
MISTHRRIWAIIAACALLLTATPRPANASNSIVPKSVAVVAVVAIAAVGAAIGVGVYYAVRHSRSLTGCSVSSADGPQLRTQNDNQTYGLVGEVSGIKPGERIRVSGRKQKKSAGAPQHFLVEKLTKDYGPCPVSPASP